MSGCHWLWEHLGSSMPRAAERLGPTLVTLCAGVGEREKHVTLSSCRGLREAGGTWGYFWAPSIAEPGTLTTAMVPAVFPLPRAVNALPGPCSWLQTAGAVPGKLQHPGPCHGGYGAGVQPLRGRGLSPATDWGSPASEV